MGGKFEKRKATAFIISHLLGENNLHLVGAHCCDKPLIVCMDMVTTVIFKFKYVYHIDTLPKTNEFIFWLKFFSNYFPIIFLRKNICGQI